jgi:hypothetical protein
MCSDDENSNNEMIQACLIEAENNWPVCQTTTMFSKKGPFFAPEK